MTPPNFQPAPPDAAGVLSWVHLGDLHMTEAGRQNDLDLQAIVQKINRLFAASLAFVFLPGDVADNGSRAAYQVVRQALDKLTLPWCAILGDHDVHEKSFRNFLHAMAQNTHYAFTAGHTRFLAMNAFDIPEPPSFTVAEEQIHWAESELRQATQDGQSKVLLLHCYPSDLKTGAQAVSQLIRRHNVRLVDMGHTHYNEISNDGQTLYTATRSTGQIEEGPVGFSITNLDGQEISWRFIPLTDPAALIITTPTDRRLTTTQPPIAHGPLTVRAKLWNHAPVASVTATFGQAAATLRQIPESQVWQAILDTSALSHGLHSLRVTARISDGSLAEDEIQVALGLPTPIARLPRDQDNQIGAWPEHGLLGTQLGPNKNGKKW